MTGWSGLFEKARKIATEGDRIVGDIPYDGSDNQSKNRHQSLSEFIFANEIKRNEIFYSAGIEDLTLRGDSDEMEHVGKVMACTHLHAEAATQLAFHSDKIIKMSECKLHKKKCSGVRLRPVAVKKTKSTFKSIYTRPISKN